jgi:thiamine biosynthesis lipoprotein
MPVLETTPTPSADAVYLRAVMLMGTRVTIQVVGQGIQSRDGVDVPELVDRAFGWFHRVEACCTRFDARSELMRLTTQIGVPVPVSALLYEAVQFAIAVAEESGGAFDPTIGGAMESHGFNREYRSGDVVRTNVDAHSAVDSITYRDVRLDADRKTITLLRPLVLDLGAVAKGLAIDMAARELAPLVDYAIDAGGDIYAGGCNAGGAPWSVGIRHPRHEDRLVESLAVSNLAVCTSGDYERRSPDGEGHHILDPRTGTSATDVASVTVIAPTAMAADALATAAFALGPDAGIHLLERQGVDGLIISPALQRCPTAGMRRHYSQAHGSIATAPRD